MSFGTWIAGGVAGGLVMLAGSMVRVVPPEPDSAATPAHPVQRLEAPVTAAPEGKPVASREHPLLTVPVQGVSRSALYDSWGQSRAAGARAHQGIDIMAPGGTPVIAAANGTVEKLYFSNGGGGITLYVRSPDRLWSYYYAHLQGYAPDLHEGQPVHEGDLLAYVGDTGNAGTGNYHLHFGVARMQPGDGWWKGQPVNPYPMLAGEAARR
ncbi:M23 family metallopeptidase [Sphingomonas sp. AOB5]|uniref:M23 family metallopeptidase n=1 Tax=Sphingomonas sp. AOB5 TaxID=3034017 RepID=UPI0023F87F03|nr:M23 family metallopeptidase [Sphingomonas sp. AOB5]MDF7773866.1 M23 family metallopeptidase [Sphingomonas sp. AOB5]